MRTVNSISGLARRSLFGRARIYVVNCLWTSALVFLSACATTSSAPVAVKVELLDALKKYETVYLLQPGDQIEVFVYRHPDLSRKLAVRPDGYITLPLINDVQVAGKTPSELSATLTEVLGKRIRDPEVSVIVENAQEPVAFVVGEVGATRSIPLRQAKTVAQALAQVGATPKTAALSSISVIRINDEGKLEARTVETNGSSLPDVYMALNTILLKPNDLIVVPETYRGQLMRAVQDVNTALNPWLQFRLLRAINK